MSLTDDWKAGKLDTTQRYWIIEKGFSKPIPRLMNELGEFIDNFGYPINGKGVKEVLAPCDYDYFVELNEKVETLSLENERLLNLKHIDFEKVQTIVKLRMLLEECKPYIQKEMETIKGAGFCNCEWAWKTSDLLTRINTALGKSDE